MELTKPKQKCLNCNSEKIGEVQISGFEALAMIQLHPMSKLVHNNPGLVAMGLKPMVCGDCGYVMFFGKNQEAPKELAE